MVKLPGVSVALVGAALSCSLAGCTSIVHRLAPDAGQAAAVHADPGYEIVTTPLAPIDSVWRKRPDGVIAVAGAPSGYVVTRAVYTNYRLHVEWRWPGKPGNGGVLLHVVAGPKDGVWPQSLQVQTKHGFAGDLLPMAGASFAEPLTTAPGAYPAIRAHTAPDSEHPVGEWNSMDLTVRGPTVDVTINGVAQNHVTAAVPASGRIGFQLEGAPYELRNLRIDRTD